MATRTIPLYGVRNEYKLLVLKDRRDGGVDAWEDYYDKAKKRNDDRLLMSIPRGAPVDEESLLKKCRWQKT